MAKKPSAVDEIAGSIPQRRRLSWEFRVASEHAETLEEIKAAFQRGGFGKHAEPAAKAISDYLHRNGIAQIGPQGVLAWLAKP
jgi:hypothetical protein